jgi:archaellum component FlaC
MRLLSAIGIIAGIVGIVISILIFLTLNQIPGILKSTAFEQLDRARDVLNSTENTVSGLSYSANEAKASLNALSASIKGTETTMHQMGKGIDEVIDILSSFGEFKELNKTSSALKSYDVSDFTNSIARLSSQIDDLKTNINSVSGSIAGVKNSIVKLKENVEDIASVISRTVLLISLFLLVFSIGLLAFSLNLYFLEKRIGKL